MPLDGTPTITNDRDGGILRLHNGKAAAAFHSMSVNLIEGGKDEGLPVYVEMTWAAESLLPYPLSEPEYVIAYTTRR